MIGRTAGISLLLLLSSQAAWSGEATPGSPVADSGKTPAILTIYHAGSLSVPFANLAKASQSLHPGVEVRRQAHGSALAIRQATELGKQADLVGSSDYLLIDRMMLESKPQWASWNLLFARNSICIVIGPKARKITSTDWAGALLLPGIRVGLSNGNLDPCGYRTLMTLYLAQETLGKKDLFNRLILDNSNITVDRATSGALISIPSAVHFKDKLVLRPKETDLLALLESSVIDYLFIYTSVAAQHHLPFLELPPEINLGDPAQEHSYANVAVRTNADTDRAETIQGSAIVYGITIPANSPRPDLAKAFVDFMQSEKGRAILRDAGQEPLPPGTYSEASRPPRAARQQGEPSS
jgi:molybdate/tungstate transport system substrate-binding protein